MNIWRNSEGMRLILTSSGELMREGYDKRFHSVVTVMYGKGCPMDVAEMYAKTWDFTREEAASA